MSHVSFIHFVGHNIKKVVEVRRKRDYDFVCPANIDYVCGEDGKTYDNKCLMHHA